LIAHVTTGAVLSATTGAFAALLTNILNNGVIEKDLLLKYIVACGGT
jgi:hypothetical protein